MFISISRANYISFAQFSRSSLSQLLSGSTNTNSQDFPCAFSSNFSPGFISVAERKQQSSDVKVGDKTTKSFLNITKLPPNYQNNVHSINKALICIFDAFLILNWFIINSTTCLTLNICVSFLLYRKKVSNIFFIIDKSNSDLTVYIQWYEKCGIRYKPQLYINRNFIGIKFKI